MSFDTTVAAYNALKVNLVLKIKVPAPVGDVYFSKYQVQSGLVIDADKIGVVNSFMVNPNQIDLIQATQDIGSATVDIQDVGKIFSTFLGKPLSSLIGLEVDMYVGLITKDGFPWSDYILEKKSYLIKTLDKRGPSYKISVQSKESRMLVPIYGLKGNLTGALTAGDTTIVINTGTDSFKGPTGRAKIDKEFIQYTSKSFSAPNTTLNGVSRGDETSDAVAHKVDEVCFYVEKVIANPIDILLQILTSTGVGTNGAYDVLFDGIGIPIADIDVTKFLAIKSQYFPSDLFTLFLYDIPIALSFIQDELLQANNLRFTETSGLLSLAILDQSVPGATLPVVDESVILAKPEPSWKISENRLFNNFIMEYFYNEGQGVYAKRLEFNDLNSQATYGIRTRQNFQFKGITTDGIAQERGNRMLARFSTPQSELTFSQFLRTYKTPPGDKVQIIHGDLPSPGGGLGLNHELELLKRAINYANGTVQATYVFTSYINLRRGLIAPYSIVQATPALNKITVGVGEGVNYKVGYVFNLYDVTTGAIIDSTNNVVNDITGDVLTFNNNWTGALALLTKLKFANYDNCNDAQRARYAFIVGNSGLFADGSGGYKIY